MILQDIISLSLSSTPQSFLGVISAPVLVQFHSRRRFSSSSSGTSLSDPSKKNLPQVIQLLRQGNNFPVFFLQPKGVPGVVRAGRSEQNDLVFADDTVSARHAVFLFHPTTKTVSVKDLASSNGTWVNGQRLVATTEAVLFDGDTLYLGELGFLFFYPHGLYEVMCNLVKR